MDYSINNKISKWKSQNNQKKIKLINSQKKISLTNYFTDECFQILKVRWFLDKKVDIELSRGYYRPVQ